MRTILDTKNNKGMFSCDGFGEYSIMNENFDIYDNSCVDKDVNVKKKLRQHRHDRHVEMIEFYDYDVSSYYDNGGDAFQSKHYF